MALDIPSEAVLAGQRVRQKICLALALSSVIPMLIVIYSLSTHVLPYLDPVTQLRDLLWFEALLVFTGLAMAAGGFVIWDLATAVSRAAAMVTEAEPLQAAGTRREPRSVGLRELSFTDPVTGLHNRRFFAIRLEEELARYRRFHHPVSVVLLDLDGFKAINDALGPGAGDETLRIVGDILTRYSRAINVICRYGGDEFAVLLGETSKTGAGLYAERIRQVLAGYPFAHGRRLTASVGIASVPDDTSPVAADLVRAADEALHAAKRAGKNRICLYEEAPERAAASEGGRA